VVHRGDHGRDEARAVAIELLTGEDPPTAIFAPSDIQAMGVLEGAADLGLDVPGDLSVVGFDDIEVARYAGLTTVAQPLEESGRRGAELLIGALVGAPVRAERLALQLVVRRTTAAPSRVPSRQSQETGQRGATCPDV
jgi:LacI family transcriptional regulator/LacI family repressor for deo operon, udp, cdd, tsx, nupC, and nupG